MSVTKQKEDELMLAVQIELDQVVTKEVCDAVYENANMPSEDKKEEVLDSECESRKTVIMDVISKSVNLQRLYFVIRSSVMGLMTGALTFVIISYLGITDFFQLVFLGLLIFIISLIISRLLDKPVVKISSKTILYLKKHRRLRTLILKGL